MIHQFEQTSLLYLCLVMMIGLSVGSFLNVMILRMPRRLLQHEPGPTTLCYPPSECPHCQHRIAFFDNVPFFSFFWLRGRCRSCHVPISYRYPAIEVFTSLLYCLVAIRFGITFQAFAAMILTALLIALAVIDFDHLILPDALTLPGIGLGLFFNTGGVFQNLSDALIGAVSGYLVLWSIYWIYKLMTGKEGLGFGDFKLLGLLGAWLGWQSLLLIILFASLLGASVGISLIVFQKRNKLSPLPFGPFLASAGFISLLWGSECMQWYWRIALQ